MKNNAVSIIAGPCSIDENNIREVKEISKITVINRLGHQQKAIAGTRIVGLKSRTALHTSGDGMGIDYPSFMRNTAVLLQGGKMPDMETPPSVLIAEEISQNTGMIIATEIMSPLVQLPHYVGRIPQGKLLPWNPAVEQLGWPIMQMAHFARRCGWHIGLKNGKWVGEHLHIANSPDYQGKTSMEKTWAGLVSFVGKIAGDIVLIHRGVDVPEKDRYRNAVIHEISRRTKLATGVKLYLDPSHSHGPNMRDQIVAATVEALKIKISNSQFLYDGVLVETGSSTTDTEQHITIEELKQMVKKVAKFRDLVKPESHKSKTDRVNYQFA
ncbi:hypothetical protein A3H86_01965 [Candidatus Roizmanbacteria bacterium RIFCSPLOWO2_02_FULL_41_9]|uniref:DAHP synthetase I/KDSA domain-containing protein n=1 Tax=Candidatus Roizmanbacteria bacterium RIFCSPLOWO2_02_FULL_41_9 TaxID=1802077 RepID=A0A1F7JQW5_9BACT|nr:MAG: hypothetical protein A3H86_01965 [Candidatus Roizmanbacteria bacterium RIFCSPLOWO2_02_FULL_41_9]